MKSLPALAAAVVLAGLLVFQAAGAAAQNPAPPPPCKAGAFTAKPQDKATDPAVVAAKAFMAANAKQPGVKTLPSGAQYKIVTSGAKDAACANPELRVRVHYEGTLPDGTVFDTSMDGAPRVYSLNGLIPGWQQVVPMMRIGDEWIIYLPPQLGYGTTGALGGKVPPNSPLIFKMKLLGLLG